MGKNYRLIEVTDKRTIKEFLDFPATLYKNDKNWIRPLDEDIEKVFNPKRISCLEEEMLLDGYLKTKLTI